MIAGFGSIPVAAQVAITPQIPLSPTCTPQPGSFCQTPVIGTFDTTVITPIQVISNPFGNGDLQIKGETAVTFDGRLQVDGTPLTSNGVFPSLLLAGLNDQLDVEIATQYDSKFDVTAHADGHYTFNPGNSLTINSLTTKSIGVDIKSDAYNFGDGTVGKLRLSSIDSTAIVDNATALQGTFSSTDGKIVFGKITGTARLVSDPSTTTLSSFDGTSADFASPFALAMDVTPTVLTQLDETGLITPTVSVTDGIEMNGSKITGLAAGTDAGDAVNVSQLQSEATTRAAADLALSNQLGALDSRVNTLAGRVDKLDNKIASSTAVAVAMGGAVFLPDMKFNLTANVGTYNGAHAGSIQFGAVVSRHVAVNAGVATGFNKGGKTAGRVGFTVGW